MKNIYKLLLALGLSLSLFSQTQAAYFGASIGYLVDGEEALYSVRMGTALSESETYSHNMELEIGYATYSDSEYGLDIYPVMANYVFKSGKDNFDFLLGAGIGMTFAEASAFGSSASDEILTLQGIAAIEYNFNESTALRVGYRYVHLDDIAGSGIDASDSVIELGVTFKF